MQQNAMFSVCKKNSYIKLLNIVEQSVVLCIGNYTATELPDGGRLTEANITRDLVIVNTDIVVHSNYNLCFFALGIFYC